MQSRFAKPFAVVQETMELGVMRGVFGLEKLDLALQSSDGSRLLDGNTRWKVSNI